MSTLTIFNIFLLIIRVSVEFKKGPCRHVNSEGQGPHLFYKWDSRQHITGGPAGCLIMVS